MELVDLTGRIVNNKAKRYTVDFGFERRLEDAVIGDKKEVIKFLEKYLQ